MFTYMMYMLCILFSCVGYLISFSIGQHFASKVGFKKSLNYDRYMLVSYSQQVLIDSALLNRDQ